MKLKIFIFLIFSLFNYVIASQSDPCQYLMGFVQGDTTQETKLRQKAFEFCRKAQNEDMNIQANNKLVEENKKLAQPFDSIASQYWNQGAKAWPSDIPWTSDAKSRIRWRQKFSMNESMAKDFDNLAKQAEKKIKFYNQQAKKWAKSNSAQSRIDNNNAVQLTSNMEYYKQQSQQWLRRAQNRDISLIDENMMNYDKNKKQADRYRQLQNQADQRAKQAYANFKAWQKLQNETELEYIKLKEYIKLCKDNLEMPEKVRRSLETQKLVKERLAQAGNFNKHESLLQSVKSQNYDGVLYSLFMAKYIRKIGNPASEENGLLDEVDDNKLNALGYAILNGNLPIIKLLTNNKRKILPQNNTAKTCGNPIGVETSELSYQLENKFPFAKSSPIALWGKICDNPQFNNCNLPLKDKELDSCVDYNVNNINYTSVFYRGIPKSYSNMANWRCSLSQYTYQDLNSADLDFRYINQMNRTPLLLALANGKVDIAKYLINLGSDLEAKDSFGDNAVQTVIKYLQPNNIKPIMTKYIINKGEDVIGYNKADSTFGRNNNGETTLFSSVLFPLILSYILDEVKNSSLSYLDQLRYVNMPNNNNITPLGFATSKGIGQSKALIEDFITKIQQAQQDEIKDAMESKKEEEMNKLKQQLIQAAQNNDFDKIKVLLDSILKANPNFAVDDVKDNNGKGLIHYAIGFGNLNGVKYLIDPKNKVNVDADSQVADNTKYTPLIIAISHTQKGQEGNTDINIYCARNCWQAVAAYLINQAGVILNKADINGFTALHWATALQQLNIINAILNQDVRTLTYQDKNKDTPLHIAVSSNDAKFLDAFVKAITSNQTNSINIKSLANIPNSKNITPLALAQKISPVLAKIITDAISAN